MKISKAGLDLIKSFEGCRLQAYKAVPTEKYYTIGYGHYGSDVRANAKILQETADALLLEDLERFEAKVNKWNGIYNFTQNEFDALVSFAYNVGNIDQLTNYGKRTKLQIASAMPAYNKSGGRILTGLTRRRAAEVKMFQNGGNAPLNLQKPTLETVVEDILNGVYGNGKTRKAKVEALGLDYKEVQKAVNARTKKGGSK